MSNSSPVSIQLPLAQRCNHINGRGHRCRMFAADPQDGLCPHHLGRLQAERAKNDEAVAELLGPLEDFSSRQGQFLSRQSPQADGSQKD